MSATFFKPETLAEVYQIPLSTIWQWLRQGKFRGAIKIGKRYRIPYSSKEDFEKRHQVHGKASA